MKFFALMSALTLLFIAVSFASLTSANPGLTLATFVPCAGIVYPMFWVAVYRLMQGYSVKVARRG